MKTLYNILTAAIITSSLAACSKHYPDEAIEGIVSNIIDTYDEASIRPEITETENGTAQTYLRTIGNPEGTTIMLYFKDHKPYATNERIIGSEDRLVVMINADQTYYLRDTGGNGHLDIAKIVEEEKEVSLTEIPLEKAQRLYESTISAVKKISQGTTTKVNYEK